MTQSIDPLRGAIRRVLLNDWDPSNAARFDAAAGEYDRFIDPLGDLIQSAVGEEAIADYLYDREHEFLCFPGLGKQRLRRVARLLAALKLDA